MHVTSVVGARPQLVKLAALHHALRDRASLRTTLVHTGQHYDENMSDVFFEELEIPTPDHHLGVGSGGHGWQTGRMLERLETVLQRDPPSVVVVFGDTNSTLAAALAAVKLHIPVAHVEAGLRSFNRSMPEEINRILTDHASELLFAPTEAAVHNLDREGIHDERVHLVGDVMYDAALRYGPRAQERSRILEELGLAPRAFALATIHRAENTNSGSRLRAVFLGLERLVRDLPVIIPLHPRSRAALEREGLLERISRTLHVVDPVGYLDMVRLESAARIVVTDSGGVQKEAFFHRVPCVTLRDETEWVELVELGWNRIVPPESQEIVIRGIRSALVADAGVERDDLYGGGTAAATIAAALEEMT